MDNGLCLCSIIHFHPESHQEGHYFLLSVLSPLLNSSRLFFSFHGLVALLEKRREARTSVLSPPLNLAISFLWSLLPLSSGAALPLLDPCLSCERNAMFAGLLLLPSTRLTSLFLKFFNGGGKHQSLIGSHYPLITFHVTACQTQKEEKRHLLCAPAAKAADPSTTNGLLVLLEGLQCGL